MFWTVTPHHSCKAAVRLAKLFFLTLLFALPLGLVVVLRLHEQVGAFPGR